MPFVRDRIRAACCPAAPTARRDDVGRRTELSGRVATVPDMADFSSTDLRGSSFDRVDLSGARLRSCDLSGSRFDSVDLHGAVLRGVELVDVEIDGRAPERDRQRGRRRAAGRGRAGPPRPRPGADAPHRRRRVPRGLGHRRAAVGGDRRARPAVDPELLHESVDGEWSFIETLRHLRVRHRRLGAPGGPRRPGALAPARPALRRDARGRRRPAGPHGAAVAGRGARRCGPTGWPTCGALLAGLTDEQLAADDRARRRDRAGRRPEGCPVRGACWSCSTRSGSTAASPSATSPSWRRARGERGTIRWLTDENGPAGRSWSTSPPRPGGHRAQQRPAHDRHPRPRAARRLLP